jgi:glycopeptide antibiotics resistance protein
LSGNTVRAAISLALIAYSAVLVRVPVFKNILFNIGTLRFRIAREGMQVACRAGVFDIDDLILNGLGVMLGYSVFRLSRRLSRRKTA